MATTKITDGTNEGILTTSLPATNAAGLAVREVAQGQQTMANSRPVVLASNQTSIPVVVSGNSNTPPAAVAPFTDNFKVFDHKFTSGDNGLLWRTKNINGATFPFNSSTLSVDMTTTTTSGSSVIRQSQHVIGQGGTTMTNLVAALMGAKKANVRQRIGPFNHRNGAFFEQDSSNLKVVVRTSASGSPVDTAVNQSAWNIDKLDGTGDSGINLDTSLVNLYCIVHNAQSVKFGVVINWVVYFCHQVLGPNNSTNQLFDSINLPVRLELTNTAATASTTVMKHYTTSVYTNGGTIPYGVNRSADLGITGKSIGASLTPLLSIRLKRSNFDNLLQLLAINLNLTASQVLGTQIVFNGTLTGATWTDLSGTSTMSQYETSATAISGGDIIFSAYTDGTGNGTSGTLPIDTGAQLYISSLMRDDATGTSSGSNTTTTFNDTSKTWATNQFVGKTVLITGGTGSGQERTITANTATQLTIAPVWSPTPDATSTFDINTSDIVSFCGIKTGGSSPTGYPAVAYRELF